MTSAPSHESLGGGGTGTAQPLIQADDISVKASWGHIYGPVSLTVPAGGVTIISGSGGRGRTALLLTLAGRMKPTSGRLDAFGEVDNPHHLFKQATVGWINEVDTIEQTIRVRDVLTEQIRWMSPWYKFVPQATEEDLERLCGPVFGDLLLPPLDAYVEELPELSGALFRIAMANVNRPPLLVVGGIDRLTRIANSQKLLERLIDLGREQTVITADVNGHELHRGIRALIPVDNLTDESFVKLQQQVPDSDVVHVAPELMGEYRSVGAADDEADADTAVLPRPGGGEAPTQHPNDDTDRK